MPSVRRLLAFVFVTFLLATAGPAPAQELAAECEHAPNGPSQLTVGAVDCLRFDSDAMGGKMPFSYYVPPACDPALGRQCPVLYFLHGLGGSYQSGGQDGLGPKGGPTPPWVHALTSGPPVDPRTLAEPWTYWEPSTWVPKSAIDMIVVAPHGSTLADGHGTGQAKSTGWQDFHPQYWEGGDSQVYDGPPPRSMTMVVDELIPYVETHFPVNASRSGRALAGYSYGSIGTGITGLRFPDRFQSLQMISGAGVPWPPACAADPGTGAEVAVPLEFPLDLDIDPAIQPQVEALINPPVIFLTQNGDGLSTDYAYTRQHHPADLVVNARAFHAGQPVIRFALAVKDSVSHRPEDIANPAEAVSSSLELSLATTPGQEMDQEAQLRDVDLLFEMNPGNHSAPYTQPYMRRWLEGLYAAVEHWDGGGTVYPEPEVFDYRSVFTDFEVWGWKFSIERGVDEFINLNDVSCDSITLRGTGVVTVTVPEKCFGFGFTRQIDLGPSPPLNEPAALGLCDSYGNTEVMALPEPGASLALLTGAALLAGLRRGREQRGETRN